jgi:hypothetical protein
MRHAPTILVCGALANKHLNGGEAWVRLNWVLGLRRLGCDVYFVEQIASPSCVDDQGTTVPFERSANLRFFQHVVRSFGLEAYSTLICDEGAQVEGRPYADVVGIAKRAHLLINISGHLTLAPVLDAVRRKAFCDEDPGFTQFWHEQRVPGVRLEGYDAYLTVGENIGRAGCVIPTCGISWRGQPRFVVLDQWPVSDAGNAHRFTTVGAWRGPFGPIEHEGRRFGLKVHEFRKIIGLPRRARQQFEIALSIHPADRADLAALHDNGWHVVDPRGVAADPIAFRSYVQGSGGECSAAQGVYVETGSGWLSDRTVQYLASGKPVLVQDTGFSANYPVGEGLVAFRTLDEAVAGADAIAGDYARHARAARHLAETCFDSDLVLRRLLADMGVEL